MSLSSTIISIRIADAKLPFILTLISMTMVGCVQSLENKLNNTVTPIVAEANAAATAAESCTDPALQDAARTAAANARKAAQDLRNAGDRVGITRVALDKSIRNRENIESHIAGRERQKADMSERNTELLASAADPRPGEVGESRDLAEGAARSSADAVTRIAGISAEADVVNFATEGEKAELAALKTEAEGFAATAAAEAPQAERYSSDDHSKRAMTAGYLAEVRLNRAYIIKLNVEIRIWTARLQEQFDVNVEGSERANAAAYTKAQADFDAAKAAANAANDAATAIATQCGCVVGPPQFPSTPYYNATWWDTASP